MLFKLVVGLICSIISCSWRAPEDPDYRATSYGPQNWEQEELAREALQGTEDDMIFHEEDEPSYAGIKGSRYRWPKKTMVYKFDADVAKDQNMTKLFEDAIKQYEENTCIRFREKSQRDISYVRVFKVPRKCYSNVGFLPQKWQPQNMSLGNGCGYIGTVVHEIGHALGLYHEHQRSDRDTYITVYGNNVKPESIKNFNTTKPDKELTFGAKYDYTSIMHYGECAFSKNGRRCKTDKSLRTMVANDGKTKLLEPFHRPGLNENDIALLKKLYNCP